MKPKLKKKIWKVLRMISSNNGAPLIADSDVQRVNADFLIRQFISFCNIWKYYLSLLEEEEEYEICAEIMKVVSIQKNFIVEIADIAGIGDEELDNQLVFVKNTIMEAKEEE